MKDHLSYGKDYKYIPATSIESGVGTEVLPDLYSFTVQIVNIIMVGHSNQKEFVLIDTGTPFSAKKIIEEAENRFGENCRPKAIILTHGHFDHVGSVIELVQHWDVDVYAHELELPFLTGKKDYPLPDSTVEGGMVSKMSAMFPNEAINLGNRVKSLPADGSVPHLSEFKWIHTPGHSPGHVSLFREEDSALIAGDAFITVKQEYLYKVFMQELEISGPPRYLTTDWEASKISVEKLEALKPSVAITGHGLPISGETLTGYLKELVENFDEIAVPDYGKFIEKSE